MQDKAPEKYEFDEFELDIPKRQLRREGEIVPLNPKAFDLLRVLVENNGRLLSKDDLFNLVWEDQIVEESNLTVNMSAIRRALGERASQPRFIVTVSGQGYRFVGPVRDSGTIPADEMIVERHTRIVVAEEEGDEQTDALPSRSPQALSPAQVSFFRRHRTAILAAIPILMAILAGGAYFRQGANSDKTATSFQVAGMKRLTNIGNVNNAALSPDGKLFVYASLEKDGRRALWLGHSDGSKTIELIPPASVVYHGLVFAPDGSSIYYNVGGQVYRMDVFGGVPEKIAENIPGHFTFAPDGKQIAYIKTDPERSTLLAFDPMGRSEREIATRPAASPFVQGTAAWSPDGNTIAVLAISDEPGNTSGLLLIATADGSARQITRQSWVDSQALVWAKDGRSLYLVSSDRDSVWESQLWRIMAADGSAQRIVTDLNVYGAVLNVSNDDKDLLVLQTQHTSNIFTAPAGDLASAKQITFEVLGKKSGWSALDWSADGRIVFTAFVGSSETIWTMDADGKNQKQLIPEGRLNSYFGLSADGRRMAITSTRGGGWDIWTANGDGSDLRQLTTGGNNSVADISPDGNWIVYRSSNGPGSLRRIPASGGDSVEFTQIRLSWPRFSPDGTMIACSQTIDGKKGLAVLHSETGQQLKVFDVPATANFNNGLRWTPSGNAVTYRDWNNGIWQQDLTGGEPRRLPGLPEEKLYSYGWSRDGKQFAFTRGTEIRDLILIQAVR